MINLLATFIFGTAIVQTKPSDVCVYVCQGGDVTVVENVGKCREEVVEASGGELCAHVVISRSEWLGGVGVVFRREAGGETIVVVGGKK